MNSESTIIIDDTAIRASHYDKGKVIRYTARIGFIELIVWLDGYWKYFVRKTAFLCPIEPDENKLVEEYRLIGYKACRLLNKKVIKLKRK